MKKMRNVALLPDIHNHNNSSWPEQEYLGLYSRVVHHKFKGQTDPVWMVYEHHNKQGCSLEEWLIRPN